MDESTHKKILQSNIELHDEEAIFYDQIHFEIWNKIEQQRISHVLTSATALIDNNYYRALDFGAGTGNLTGKLLQMGFEVWAVDISTEMYSILKNKFASSFSKGKLRIINANIEELFFKEKFDLITCYSVLHHLFNYLEVVKTLTTFLKKGGVMYLDHEASPFYWHTSQIRRLYVWSVYFLNKIYKFVKRIRSPSFNYEWSDYHCKNENNIDHTAIEKIFRDNEFNYYERKDYHLHRTAFKNPFFSAYRLLCKPDMSYWIAKNT
ncbi:class I SAM-dependent methyltransferase [Candidatus Bathyarchaeota archaeon]|nr:class I SAM-dependent methyltransferase [Candidatus Bathyarchaeota archaeon]